MLSNLFLYFYLDHCAFQWFSFFLITTSTFHCVCGDSSSTREEESYKVPTSEKYKLVEIFYSQKEAWNIINSPEYVNLSVVKRIKEMWLNVKPPNIIEKKGRRRTKKTVTTTMVPSDDGDYDSDYPTTPHHETTTELLETTTRLEETTQRVRLPGRQNPFILIEGTLTTSRRKLLRELMKHTTFAYIRNFRKTPFKYHDKFGDFKLLKLRRAYVTLQFYITGRDIESILEDRPVIMSGFWMRQAAEMIARKHQRMDQLPPAGSDCYQWPSDLVRPDLVFFLHTPRTGEHLQPETQERLKRVIEVYKRMSPPVISLEESYSTPSIGLMNQMRADLVGKLKTMYPHAETFLKYKLQVKNPFVRRSATMNKTVTGNQRLNVTVIDDCIVNKTSVND